MNISLRDILEGQQKINQNNNNNNLFQKKATNEMGSLKIVNNTIDFPSLDLKKIKELPNHSLTSRSYNEDGLVTQRSIEDLHNMIVAEQLSRRVSKIMNSETQKNQNEIDSKPEIAKNDGFLKWKKIKQLISCKNKDSFNELIEEPDTQNCNGVILNNINIKFEPPHPLSSQLSQSSSSSLSSVTDVKNPTSYNSFISNLMSFFSNKPIDIIEKSEHDGSKDDIVYSDNNTPNEKNDLPKKKSILNKLKKTFISNKNKSFIQLNKINECINEDVDIIPPPLPITNETKKFSFVTILPKKEKVEEFDITSLTSSQEVLNTDSDPESSSNSGFHEETQYTNLIREILQTGYSESGRNGETITKFGYSMRYSLRNGVIPILTTKKLAWRVCFEELFWFIRGCTSNKELQEKNVHIWDQNSSREFLDSRGLYYLEEGDLGPIYGFQWRHFNAEYIDYNKCYQGEGIDQLQQIIDTLKNPETRSSRRMIMTAWNPCQLNYMALPPCHILAQFNVRENKYLSCALYQRSGDVGLGIPFNIASYSLLTHIIAKHCGLEADEFVHFLGNCHIYKEHVDALTEQIKRKPFACPKIEINNVYDSIDEYNLDDISWNTPYESHNSIKMAMKA